MITIARILPVLVLWWTLASSAGAVELGDSRASVLKELGEPQSRMSAGNREFLHYESGRVEITAGVVSNLEGGLVKAVSGQSRPMLKPRSSSQAPITASRMRSAHWWTDLEQAKARAKRDDKRILALFTGSDWCPPCVKFEAEVAHDEQFAGIFAHSFVFFKNDWLRHTPQPEAIVAEVDRVRRAYRIRRYPTLKVLNADGEVLGEVKWTEVQGGGSFKEIMIEAIDDTRKATKDGQVEEKGWWPF